VVGVDETGVTGTGHQWNEERPSTRSKIVKV
jgi:hypothetical protein